MSMIILDDVTHKDAFYPFSAIRSVADLRFGILTFRKKWQLYSGEEVQLLSEVKDTERATVIPANSVPIHEGLKYTLLNSPWEMISRNHAAIIDDIKLVKQDDVPPLPTNRMIHGEAIYIQEGAIMEHCFINASAGPVFIGKGAEIMEGTMIRGPVAICDGAVVKMGSKLYSGTTIGPNCIAGGEIKNTIMIANSNKAHDGYLGDSMIGEWCNMGAGTSNSNLKNTAGNVRVWNHGKAIYDYVGIKAGLLLGDYSRCAINTSFNTGTVAGICCNIFGGTVPPKYIPDFTWGAAQYELDKALRDIHNWMQLKGRSLSELEKEKLTDIYLTKFKGHA